MTYGDLSRARRTNDMARIYGEKIKTVGEELGCGVVDTFAALGGHGKVEQYRENLVDGLHLSTRGNILVYQALMQLIEKDFPQLAPTKDNNNNGEGLLGHGKEVGVALDQKLWDEFY